MTKPNVYPLPNIHDLFMIFGHARASMFSTLDLNSGFWQTSVDGHSQDYTTFSSWDENFKFKRLPFGLINSAATFQKVMYVIVAGLNRRCSLCYIDDILVFSTNSERHLADL